MLNDTSFCNRTKKIIRLYYRKYLYSIIQCFILAILIYLLHIYTYVWQSTSLSDFIHRNKRTECRINEKYNRNDNRKYKIGMISIYSDFDIVLLDKIIENRRNYCKKYNYTFIIANEVIDSSRPVAWSKLLAVKKYLPQFDYLMYIDMDIVIMNSNISLDYFIINSPINKDILITNDWNGINTGVWIIKNNSWSINFLDLLWNQKQLISKRSIDGKPHPFEYEQRAFHYILQTNKWKERNLPIYSNNNTINEIRKHFYYFPQCSFNSYSLHPFDLRGERYIRQYVKNDFLIHFAGKKGIIKTNLMNYYLDLSKN